MFTALELVYSASPKSEAISLILACCSKSSSFDRHAHTLSDASTELRVDLEEVLELSFFGCTVTCTEVTRNIVHDFFSHGIIKDLVEQSARLCVVVVSVGVRISADRSRGCLGVNGVLLVLHRAGDLRWLIVWSLTIAVHIHNSVTLIVGGSKSSSVWAVDWNLMVV